MRSDESTRRCLSAFSERRYEDCVKTGDALLRSGARHSIVQVMLISIQRLCWDEILYELAPQILAATANQRWHNSLLRLTLGQVDESDVLALVNDESKKCQFQFYRGCRFETDGRKPEAIAAFAAALACNCRCDEHEIVGQVLDLANVEGIIQRSIDCRTEGQIHASLDLAKQAQTLALEKLGAEHPGYAISLMNLSSSEWEMGHREKALDFSRCGVETAEKVFGDASPFLVPFLIDHGYRLRLIGNLGAAKVTCERAFEPGSA